MGAFLNSKSNHARCLQTAFRPTQSIAISINPSAGRRQDLNNNTYVYDFLNLYSAIKRFIPCLAINNIHLFSEVVSIPLCSHRPPFIIVNTHIYISNFAVKYQIGPMPGRYRPVPVIQWCKLPVSGLFIVKMR